MITYLLIGVLTLCYSLYYYVTRTFNYWSIRNVASTKTVPLFGNMLDAALRKKNLAVVYKEIYDQFPDEKVVGVYRMITPSLLLRDLDIIKQVLIKDFDSFSDRGISFGEKGLGNNLFHADSEKWRILRNRFTPIFTTGKIKNMIYLLEQRGDKLVDYVHDLCSRQKEQEVHSLFKKYTMATISACAFGLEVDTISDKYSIFTKMDDILFSPNFMDELDMMYPGILKKLGIEPFPKEVSEFISGMVTTVITERKGVPSNRKDFMDFILEMRQEQKIYGAKKSDDENEKILELTDEIIVAQALAFYGAGYETSSTTMAFMMYEAAKNPDVQNKLIAEVDAVLKKYDGKLTAEALSELTYMEKVFDETLRLYPVVDPIQRRAQQDYKIPDTDITLKKGQMVFISCLGIHHDERYYPNPEKFDPERFSTENSAGRHSCAYIPFGTGPRNCIGMRFAKIQSRVCLTKMFSQFRVEPSEKTVPNMKFIPRRIIIAPERGIYLNIIPRNM